MRLVDLISTAQGNLFRSKLRTFLTVLAVLVGTTTLQMTTAVGEGARSYLNQQLSAEALPDTLFIYPNSANQSNSNTGIAIYNPKATTNVSVRGVVQSPNMTGNDINNIKNTSGIVKAFPNYTIRSNYIQYLNGTKYVVELTSLYPNAKIALAAGSLPSPSDKTKIVLPYPYVQTLGFSNPDQAIGKQVTINIPNNVDINQSENIALTISGVTINSVASQASPVSYLLVSELSSYQENGHPLYQSVYATNSPNLSANKITSLKNKLSSEGYQALTYSDVIARFGQVITIVQLGLSLFAAITLLAASIGIINTLLMSVLERVQEIGLMKALGMKRLGVFFIFSFEAISIGFWGGVFGAALAFILGNIINIIATKTFLQNSQGFTLMVFNPVYVILIIVGAMLLGFLAGVLPAVRASRLDPIEALRHE